MDILTRHVTSFFCSHAGRYGLNPETVEARYVLNWGGFVNASFCIQDGNKSYHLKLAKEESLPLLARWASLSQRLTDRYHAQPVLDWIEIPGTPYQGLLFAHIPGHPADFVQPSVLKGVLDLLLQLHADRELAAELSKRDPDAEKSAEKRFTGADTFSEVYISRFREDLAGVRSDPPPFISPDLLDWMTCETQRLELLVLESPAFQRAAGSPIHGDLWLNNILVTDTSEWYIIDWDDLQLGDPALDYSTFLGSLWRSGAITLQAAVDYLPTFSPEDRDDFLDRFHLYLRALLLDEIIDSLADWVEASVSPEYQPEVRAEKERIHRIALEEYRRS